MSLMRKTCRKRHYKFLRYGQPIPKGGTHMDFAEVPIGFGMALAQNEEAMNAFAMMTAEEKQKIWNKARHAHSEAEMNRIVSNIIKS